MSANDSEGSGGSPTQSPTGLTPPDCVDRLTGLSIRITLSGVEPDYTRTQGQYLGFIYYYTKIHGIAPAEADIQRHFETSPPAIHQMIVTLEKHGLIARTPGQARSIRLRLPRTQLPDLE